MADTHRSFRYGHDIFCNERRVDLGADGDNGGEVADLFSRCLRQKVMQPALLDPITREQYEAAVDMAARELFRAICVEDGRNFVEETSGPNVLSLTVMSERDAVEIIKVELMEVRNATKARLRRA